MEWRKWWRYGWGWWGGGPRLGGWALWAADPDLWIKAHLKAAVWDLRGLAQFIKENADKLEQADRDALIKEAEGLLKYLKSPSPR